MNANLEHPFNHYQYDGTQVEGIPEVENLVILTSLRDVCGDDNNGQELPGIGYQMGATEALIRATNQDLTGLESQEHRRIITELSSLIGDKIRITGIIIDDLEDQVDAEWKLFPSELRTQSGELASSLIAHTPSQFRTVSSKRNPDLKAAMKAAFERQVSEVASSMGATLMLSDHFMLQIHDLLNDWRILNVHPAITNGQNALKGKTPTKDAIDRANGRFVDPHTGLIAPPRFITGATFHIMDGGIDTGPAITDIENTHFTLSTEAPQLRSDNYIHGKLPVLGGGFSHYLNSVRHLHTTGLDPRSNLTLTT